MKAMFRVLVLILFLCCCWMGNAYADSDYWTAEAGFFSSDESVFDTGFTLQGALGTPATSLFPSLTQSNPIWSKVSFEAGIGYSHAEFEESVVLYGIPLLSIDGSVDVIPITATALVRHPLNTDFEIYGGGGLGLYYVKLEAAGYDDSSFEFGLHLQGGIAYNLNDQFDLTAEIQWATVGEDSAGGTNFVFGVRKSF